MKLPHHTVYVLQVFALLIAVPLELVCLIVLDAPPGACVSTLTVCAFDASEVLPKLDTVLKNT